MLCSSSPIFIPFVSKFHQKHKLDNQKQEAKHCSDVTPHIKKSVLIRNEESSRTHPYEEQKLDKPEAIVDVGSEASAVLNVYCKDEEYEEEAGHAKTDSVHCRVPDQLLTVHSSLHMLTDISIERNMFFH